MQPVIQRSFGAGELAPVLHARADQAKYATGLRTCRNFVVRREGGVSNRPGLRFVSAAKDNVSGKLLFRYVSETIGQSVLIEAGSGYFRFYRNGAVVRVSAVPAYNGGTAYVPGDLVVTGGVNYYCVADTTGNAPPNASYWYALTADIYEVPTPYGGVDPLFKWTQSGNVITITQHGQKPRELVYSSLTRWVLRDISTAPTLAAPAGGAGVAGAAGALTFKYVITSLAKDSFEESNGSSPVTIASAVKGTPAAPNALSWTADPGADSYNVYEDPYGNGVYGFIGSAATNAFHDVGQDPDFSLTPPEARTLFGSTDNYPETSAVFQQRRFFANTNLEPDAVYGSRIGFPSNFGIASPLQDDDAVTFRIAGNNHHAVRFLVALKAGLVLMTDGGEWLLTGGGGSGTPITPSSLNVDQDTYVGCEPYAPPVVVGNTIVYVQARGTILRDLAFSQAVEGLAGQDLTIFATHLFEGKTILAIDYQQTPDSIIWCVLSDGTLVGLTYIPEQQLWGWHRHDTAAGGIVEDLCVVPETDRDTLYVLVARTIGGSTVRFLEKLESRIITDFDADSFFVDSGLSYSGVPAGTFSGLDHLNGQVVAVLADGVVVYDGDPAGADAATYTVAGGLITIPAVASNVHIGLPIRFAEIETLDLDVQGTDVRDKQKRVGAVTVLVEKSARAFAAGPDADHLEAYAQQPWDDPSDLYTGPCEVPLVSEFSSAGRVLLRQTAPLPITVLGIIPLFEIGG